jgi:hypothetical protein
VLTILASGYLAYELFWGRLSAYSLWFFFALGTGALSGKWGAGPGYFITAVAASCVLTGLALGRLLRLARLRAPRAYASVALLAPALFLAQAAFFLHLPTSGPVFGPVASFLGVDDEPMQGQCATFDYYDAIGYTQLGHLLTPEDYAAGERLLDYVREAEGPVLSEEAAFSLLAGKPVVTNPTQLRNLYENGMLDAGELIQRIYDGEFEVIVLRAQFYPDPVLGAIWFRYEAVDVVCMNGFLYHVLKPKSE